MCSVSGRRGLLRRLWTKLPALALGLRERFSTLSSEPMLNFFIPSRFCTLGQTQYYVIFICISLALGEADFICLCIIVFVFLDIFISYNIRELYICACAKSLQSCLTLCDPMDCSPPGSSVHGLLQARILEWIAMPFSSRSVPSRDQTWVS